ncbi:MAG: CBS domain-containing protein [Candidatus Eisenbacteria bacterium]
MTPLPRYRVLNRALTKLRGGSYSFHIKGQDELNVTHNSVMLESCNASFRSTSRSGPRVRQPLQSGSTADRARSTRRLELAAPLRSPVVAGDAHRALPTGGGRPPTIRGESSAGVFRDAWVRSSVLELYQENIASAPLVGIKRCEDPFEALAQGQAPQLGPAAPNGTVYRWNRACYGITDGKPHLRIENRVLPSGPSVIDEVANAAFWFGLAGEFAHQYEDVSRGARLREVKNNFLSAARLRSARAVHLDGRKDVARATLILEQLLPRAADGLRRGKILDEDAARYLKVIEDRVSKEQTGAAWMLKSLALMDQQRNPNERMNALVAALIERQKSGRPVAEWEPARLEESGGWKHTFLRVEQFMSKDLFTVTQDEPIDLVANLMKWERIRHVLVEDNKGRLVGLVSYRALLRAMADGWNPRSEKTLAVADIMKRDPICIAPDTPALRAIEIMRDFKIACLPVVKNAMLVGVITESDFMDVAADLLAQKLKE